MRKMVVAAVLLQVLSVVTVSHAGSAGSSEPRVEEKTYIGIPDLHRLRDDLWPLCGTAAAGGIWVGCVVFEMEAAERWITVKITDASGQEVPAAILRDRDGQGNDGVNQAERWRICGSTRRPIKVGPTAPGVGTTPVRVIVYTDTCDPHAELDEAVVSTTGTVLVTFHDERPRGS